MFVGHLAVALSAKKVEPALPLAATVGAAFALDLLWPLLLLAGVEVVRVNPGDTAFTHLAFESYPWSHSLALVLVWSVVGLVVGRSIGRSTAAGVVLGLLVLSHWLLDWVTHRPDLPLWPGGPRVGLGLWYSIPGTIVIEAGMFALGLWIYTRAFRPVGRRGTIALVSLVALTGTLWISQPWAPPPDAPVAVALGALVLWLLLPWAAWIDRHRRPR